MIKTKKTTRRALVATAILSVTLGLVSCIGPRVYHGIFADLPREVNIAGFEGRFVMNLESTKFLRHDPYPINASEGRRNSSFTVFIRGIDEHTPNVSGFDISLLKIINTKTGQIYEFTADEKTVPNRRTTRALASYYLDLPIGTYNIKFSGRVCIPNECRNFQFDRVLDFVRVGHTPMP